MEEKRLIGIIFTAGPLGGGQGLCSHEEEVWEDETIKRTAITAHGQYLGPSSGESD